MRFSQKMNFENWFKIGVSNNIVDKILVAIKFVIFPKVPSRSSIKTDEISVMYLVPSLD